MRGLIKNKRGMSLVEVMIALAVLGLLVVPIMMAFMNTQIYARKIDKQNEVNAITRTVTQNVMENFKRNEMIKAINDTGIDLDGDGTEDKYLVVDIDGDGIDDKFSNIIKKAKDEGKEITVDNIAIFENSEPSTKYKYSITYDQSYDDTKNYPDVYNFLITVKDYSDRVHSSLKIAVNIDDYKIE